MPIWLIQIIVGVILTVASTLIQQANAPKPIEAQQRTRGFRGSVQTGGRVPQSFLVGTIGVPGKLEYRNTWGNSGETPNAYLVDVISFGDLPITAFTGLYVNSEEVTVAASGHVTQGYPVAEKSNKLWWEFFDGTQTVANTYLTGAFGSDPDRPWLSDMIGEGVPYLTLTALIDEAVWPGFPTYMAEFQGIPLYDPREDTTAGGSGSQLWADPSTWAFSDNNVVIIYNILRGIQYDGARVWGGDARAYQLPYAVWAAAMDACDAAIGLDGGGTEKAYRAGREIFVNERPADVIRDLLVGANARIALSQGIYYILVDVPASADFTFTDADVIVTEGTTLEPFPNLDSIINGATASYIEPSQAWESKETAPYYRSDLEAEDDDRQQLEGLDLNTTFSGTQAQRIIKATVEESRRFTRLVVPLTPGFGQYRPLQVGAWTSDANGYTSKLFLITAKTEAPNANVVFGLQEIDPSDFDWTAATDEQPLSFAPLTPILPPAQPMAGFAVSPYVFPDATATGRRAGILLEYTGALPDIRAVLYQVREDFGAGNTVAEGEITYDAVNSSAAQPIGGLWTLPNTDYEVRAKFLPPDGSGRTTDWSSWLAVTTPDVAITESDLDASLQAFNQWVSVNLRDLTEQAMLTTSGAADQDLANYSDRLYVLNQVSIGDAVTYAASTEALLLALGADGSALADAISAIEAAAGDVTAGFLSRATVFASPGGGWSRVGWQVRSAVGDGFNTDASFYMESKTTGESRWVLKAAEGFFVNDLGNIVGMFTGDGASFNVAYIKNLTSTNITANSLDLAEVGEVGSIITSLVANEAITGVSTSSTAGSTSVNNTGGGEVTLQSITLTPNGGQMVVEGQLTGLYNGGIGGGSDANHAFVAIRLYKGSTLLKTSQIWCPTLSISGAIPVTGTAIFVDPSPGTSSVTYTLRAENVFPSGVFNSSAGVSDRVLILTNLKK